MDKEGSRVIFLALLAVAVEWPPLMHWFVRQIVAWQRSRLLSLIDHLYRQLRHLRLQSDPGHHR